MPALYWQIGTMIFAAGMVYARINAVEKRLDSIEKQQQLIIRGMVRRDFMRDTPEE